MTEDCNNEDKCVHCEGIPQAGYPRCKIYKYEEELISIQTKERVTRSQEIAILNRRHSDFKQLDYAGAVVRATGREPQQLEMTSRQQEREQLSNKKIDQVKRTQLDIVCVSPKTGKLYQSTVSLPCDTPGISDAENGTSETSRRVRKEVKEIYREVFSTVRE